MILPLRVSGVTRSFGSRLALDRATFELGAGEIVGLVGPNGSGKTTLLKAVAGFLLPDAGEVHVFGHSPQTHRARVMERARFAFAPPALFEQLTAAEHLRYLGGLQPGGTPKAAAVDEALDAVGLLERAHERVGHYSFGMRQRLALAQALVPRPELLVLDEPTDGLDPLAVLELRAVLERLRDEHGVAVLLSSHLLVEIDRLVDRMLVLSEGRTLFSGHPGALLRSGRVLRLAVSDGGLAAQALQAAGLVARDCETLSDSPATLALEPDSLRLTDAAAILGRAGVELHSYHVHEPTLEEALLERLRADREERAGARTRESSSRGARQ